MLDNISERKAIENALIESESLLEKASKSALSEVSPISDVRSSQEYREEIIKVLVRRAILQAKGDHIL